MRYVSIMSLHPSIAPTPRNFAHTNQSNPNTTWGGKYERQCMLVTKLFDWRFSLLTPALSSLFQKHLSNWHNFSIGGDKVEHVAWQLQYDACPNAPGKVLIWMGTNNIKNNNSSLADEGRHAAPMVCNIIDNHSTKSPHS